MIRIEEIAARLMTSSRYPAAQAFDKDDIAYLLAEVKRQFDRADAAEAECLEQGRLNGIGAERELALMAKVKRIKTELDDADRRFHQRTASAITERDRADEAEALALSLSKVIETHRRNVWGNTPVDNEHDEDLYRALSDPRLLKLRGKE